MMRDVTSYLGDAILVGCHFDEWRLGTSSATY